MIWNRIGYISSSRSAVKFLFRLYGTQATNIGGSATSTAASAANNYFQLFPSTFPNGGPPKESFICSLKKLRREYRSLQSEHHPDVVGESQNESNVLLSAIVNRAYSTLKNPYTRIAYVIEKNHPDHLDVLKDEVAKELIRKFQSESPEFANTYKTMLMQVLDAHEELEMAELEKDLEGLEVENDQRLEASEKYIDTLLKSQPINWNHVVLEAIKIKYWVNIQSGIKDWEVGKPVHLTH